MASSACCSIEFAAFNVFGCVSVFFFFLKFVHGTTGFVSVLSEVIIVHGIHVPYQSILLKS